MQERVAASHSKDHLIGLDLVRGLAAIAVLAYHIDFMFGLRGRLLPGGYTAVDLFFVLSGLVIAKTYEDDIVRRRMSFYQMALRRLARLYPLYILTTVIGIFIMTARYRSNSGYFDIVPLTISAIANVIMLPTPLPPYGGVVLFPYNAASWSIFYEVAINIVFFFFLAGRRTLTLVALWIVAGAAMLATLLHFGGVDLGWGAPNFVGGLARVCFSFLSGMLIWRRSRIAPWSSPAWLLFALIGAHLAYMQFRLWAPDAVKMWGDAVVVFVLLPAVVVCAAGVVMPRALARASRLLGDVSYAVYLTQGALIIAAAGLTQMVIKTKIYDLAPWAGFVFLPVCVLASYFVFTYFEAPARRWIRVAERPPRATMISLVGAGAHVADKPEPG